MNVYEVQPDIRRKVARRLEYILRSPKSTVSPAVRAGLKQWLKEASQKGSLSLDMGSLNAAVEKMIRLRIITRNQFEAILRDCDPVS